MSEPRPLSDRILTDAEIAAIRYRESYGLPREVAPGTVDALVKTLLYWQGRAKRAEPVVDAARQLSRSRHIAEMPMRWPELERRLEALDRELPSG